jgi:hypothetical protein
MPKKTFDANRAVKLFKGGMKISDIAVEMGYPKGQGQNRTRKALVDAGVYEVKQRTGSTATAKAKGPQLVKATKLSSSHNPDVLMAEAYNVVASRYRQLTGRQRTGWMERLIGMLLTSIGAGKRAVKPVALAEGLQPIRKAA